MPVSEVSLLLAGSGNCHSTHASFGVVEFDSTSESSLRQKSKLGDHKFIELSMVMLLAGSNVVWESGLDSTYFFRNEMHFEGNVRLVISLSRLEKAIEA